METPTQRSWRLLEFIAHTAPVNCLALGHKSGRVLVTGGDDKKVNLWAVGKDNCIMSLSGHSAPIETVRFSSTEDMVCAGSSNGVIKAWDLEAAKIVRTLTGHIESIKTVDFHPYADFLTSGSVDSSIKLWDIRKKGCIFTYKGHVGSVNSVKFSPDGQWIASGGEDCTVKIWDLRTGRVLHEFSKHTGPILSVEYHPHEFLLASSSTDKCVMFWDLDKFNLISATDKQTHASRCVRFSDNGDCLFAGSCDTLSVFGWEPLRTLDTVFTHWSKVRDISSVGRQLIGAGYHSDVVMIWVVDLVKVCPIGRPPSPSSTFLHGMSIRKSFNKQKPISRTNSKMHQRPIEENETEPEEDNLANIPDVNDYNAVFSPNRTLNRSPPPEELFIPPDDEPEITDSQQTISQIGDLSCGEPIEESSLAHKTFHRSDIYEESNVNVKSPRTCHGTSGKVHSPVSFDSSSKVSIHLSPVSSSICNTVSTVSSATLHSTQSRNNALSSSYNSGTSTVVSEESHSRLNSRNDSEVTKDSVFTSGDELSQIVSKVVYRCSKIRANQCKLICKNTLGKIKKIQYPLKATTKRVITSLKNHRVASIQQSPSEPTLSSQSKRIGDGVKVPQSHKPELLPKPKFQPSRSPHGNGRVGVMRPEKKTQEKSIEFIPMTGDTPVGLEPNEFLPKKGDSGSSLTEAEVLSTVMKGHEDMMRVLINRQRNLQIILSVWHTKDLKTAIETAIEMGDMAVMVDLLTGLTRKPNLWNLDLCNLLLPSIRELLQSKYETYMTVGCDALRLILRNFSLVIRNNVQWSSPTIGVDISKEERYSKCVNCFNLLVSIRAFLLKRQTVQGKLGQMFRELVTSLEAIDAT